jgi:hypothetical protein
MDDPQERIILTGDNVQEDIRDAATVRLLFRHVVQRRVITDRIISGLQSRVPHLPVEIYGVIAEHLIGQHAFGTAANINILSKAVHGETSPVLWETVIIERAYDDRWRTMLPINMKYTK